MRNTVWVLFVGAAGALGAAFSGEVGIDLSIAVVNHGGYASFVDGTLVFRQGSRTVKASLDPAGKAHAVVPPGTWEIACDGPNLYCPPVVRPLRDPKLILDGFGLTTLSAALVVPLSAEVPKNLAVQGIFSLPDNKSSKQSFEYRTLAKVEGGRAVFRLPTTRNDLRLGAEGFAPVYRWGIEIKPGKQDLGELAFQPGSSLFGVAFEPGTETPASDVEIRLEPLARTGLGGAGRLLGTTTRTSSRGIFQMTGLTPSRYRLVLLRAGKQVGGMAPIEIPPNSEVRLDVVRLTPPALVRIKLNPVLTPNEKPWQVSLKQLSPDLLGVPLDLSAKSSPEGEVEFASLPIGPYQLFVRDDKASRLFYERVEIVGDLERTIDLPISTLQGRIRLGSSALKTHLTLGSGDFDESSFDSDDQGRFEGAIRTPTRGVLFATIDSTDPPFSRKLVVRDARVDADRHAVDVDIALENKIIEGRVTAASGVGVPGLSVLAVADQLSMIETTSRPDGSFELRPAASGVYSVSLRRSGKGIGKTHTVDLTHTDRATLMMSIGQYRKGQFHLLSAGGDGVPAARVYVKPLGYAGLSLQTDPTGSSQLVWPQGVERGFVSASSISAPAISQCITVTDPNTTDPEVEAEITISLPPQPGARIRLVPEKAPPSAQAITEDELLVVSRVGGVWRRSEVESLSAAGGMPPGEYATMWNRGAVGGLVDRLCSAGPPPGLRWTSVGAGQEATIQFAFPTNSSPAGK